MKKVLVIDDEKNIVNIINFNLKKEGYKVFVAYDGQEGLKIFFEEHPDIVLLDIMMPIIDGYEACKKIREKSNVPIIMLTAKAEEFDKVLGLELGADDYVTKPFGVRELMARIKANLRKYNVVQSEEKKETIINISNIKIDLDRFEVSKENKIIDLTFREFELIKLLILENSKIFSRESLLEKVWGYDYFGDVRTVDVTIRRLREKIEDDPSKPKFILTKRGVGYYFGGV